MRGSAGAVRVPLGGFPFALAGRLALLGAGGQPHCINNEISYTQSGREGFGACHRPSEGDSLDGSFGIFSGITSGFQPTTAGAFEATEASAG